MWNRGREDKTKHIILGALMCRELKKKGRKKAHTVYQANNVLLLAMPRSVAVLSSQFLLLLHGLAASVLSLGQG